MLIPAYSWKEGNLAFLKNDVLNKGDKAAGVACVKHKKYFGDEWLNNFVQFLHFT